MNTRILFYCTHVSHDGFSKIVFETILNGTLTTEEANEWVDENISTHYNNFYLEFVLDWFVVLCEEVDAEPKETEIIKTVNGMLIFEDTIDHLYYRIGKATEETRQIKKETRKIKKETEKLKAQNEYQTKKLKGLVDGVNKIVNPKKDYPSVWIEPSGEVHEVGFANHNEFADDWFEENDPEEFNRIHEEYTGKYPYEHLQDKGWIRILGWTDPPSFVITARITPKQKTALRDYCMGNDVPYEAFPEILKS